MRSDRNHNVDGAVARDGESDLLRVTERMSNKLGKLAFRMTRSIIALPRLAYERLYSSSTKPFRRILVHKCGNRNFVSLPTLTTPLWQRTGLQLENRAIAAIANVDDF